MYVCILYKLYIYMCVESIDLRVCISIIWFRSHQGTPQGHPICTRNTKRIRGESSNYVSNVFFFQGPRFFSRKLRFFQYISSPAWAEVGVVEASVVHSHGEMDQVQIQVLHTQVIA